MLSPTDLKLFEILDEFIDKSLTNGCIIQRYENIYDTLIYIHSTIEETRVGIVKGLDGLFIELKETPVSFGNYKKIGHYPTLSVFLGYCIKNKCCIVENTDKKEKTIHTSILIRKNNSDKYFVFDLTKEPKHWSEKKKQGLLLFLQSL